MPKFWVVLICLQVYFQLVVGVHDICSTVRDTATGSGNIVTPNKISGDYAYAMSLNCDVTLTTGTAGGSIKLHFNSFDTEQDNDGCFDSVTIDGTEYCGGYTNKDLCFTKSSVLLHFESDNYEESKDDYTGFDIEFVTSETNQCACFTEVDDSSTDSEECVFPFTYEGVKYFQCAGSILAGEKPFCATEVTDAGVLEDDSKKKFCNMSLEACQQICMTTTGEQCLVPFTDAGTSLVVDSCFRKTEKDETLFCPVQRGRNFDLQVDNLVYGTCQLDHCKVLDTCGTNTSKTSGEMVSLAVPFLFPSTDYYPTNTDCLFNYYSIAEESYYTITFYRLDVQCEDAVKIGDFSESFGYNLCANTNSIGFNTFTLCMPTSHVSLDFKTGDVNDGRKKQRSGFLATYEQVDKSECQIENEEAACSLPGGRTVTEPTSLKGKFYPLPYPADSSCLWKIETQNEDLLIKITVSELNLGILHDEFTVTDSILVTDLFDRNISYLPGAVKPYESFLSTSPNVTILFESGFYFNWHQNFQLEVSFLNLTNDLDQYAEAGFCTSSLDKDICKFPFTYNEQEHETCAFLDQLDESPTCISYKNKKVVCDTSNAACIREFPVFTGYDVVYQSNTEVDISWTTSNKFWEYFEIYVDRNLVEDDVKSQTFTITVPDNAQTVLVEIKMIEFIHRPRSLHLTLRPDLKLDVGTSSSITDVTIKWDENQNFTSIKQSVQTGVDANLITLAQTFGIDLSEKTDNLNENQYTASGLIPGLVYQFGLTGTSGQEQTFDMSVPPSEIPREDFNFTETSASGDNVTLSGSLTAQTICSSISFEFQAVNTPSSRRRRSPPTSAVCSLDNGCIDPATGEYSVDLGEQMSLAGTCYSVSATSSTNSITSDPTATSFCTRPPQIDPDTVTVDVSTTSNPAVGILSLTWAEPEPANFDDYVISVSHCPSCDCNSNDIEVYQAGGYTVDVAEFTLDNLEPGVRHFVTIKTRKIYSSEVKESAEFSTQFDTYPSNASLVTISFHNSELYLDWVTPQVDDEASTVLSVGFWSVFRVSFFKYGDENNKITDTRTTGASADFPLSFSDFAEVYEVQLETLSCNEEKISVWGTLDQVSVPETAPADAFSIKLLTSNSFQVNCVLAGSSKSDIKFTYFRIAITGVSPEDIFCNGIDAKFSDGIEPNTAYRLEISTAFEDSASKVPEVYAQSIQVDVTTYPDESVFEYVPSNVLSFSEIKVNFNFTGILKSIKSVVLLAQSVQKPNKKPSQTEVTISSVTGTITSTGHLRHETYEVTLTLKSENDDDFIVKTFTTNLITFTSTTVFGLEKSGYISMLLSADDSLDPSITQYYVLVQTDDEPQAREITFEKSKVCLENQSPKCQLFIEDLDTEKVYKFQLFTIFNGFTSVNKVDIKAMTSLLDSIFEYRPSDVLSFSEIKVHFNLTGFLEEVKSVLLLAKSVQDPNNETFRTEVAISSPTGTIISTGHQRHDTYEVTLIVNFENGTNLTVEAFTTDLITFTSSTIFELEAVDFNSVLLSAEDSLDPSITQYYVLVRAEGDSQTREITFEKAEVCLENQPSRCQFFIHDLQPEKLYNFELFTVFNRYQSVNKFEFEANTTLSEDSIVLSDFSETSLTITLSTLPFINDSSVRFATVLVGVDNINFNVRKGPFNNWNKVLGNDKDSATGDTWVYQAGEKVPYPPPDDETSLLHYTNSVVTLKLGQDSPNTCETEDFCNGELKEDTKYYLRFLGEDESGANLVFGPLGEFTTANSKKVTSASIGSAGLIAFIVLAVLLLILLVFLIVYCCRHGRRSKSRRPRSEPRQAPLQRPYIANPQPFILGNPGPKVSRNQRRSHGFDNVDSRSPDDPVNNFEPLNNSFTSDPSPGFVTVTAAPTASSSSPNDLPRLQTHVQTPYYVRNPLAGLDK